MFVEKELITSGKPLKLCVDGGVPNLNLMK